MVELTEQDIEEIDKIIKETVVVSEWVWDGESSIEYEDGGATLVHAARRVREYLKTKEKKA